MICRRLGVIALLLAGMLGVVPRGTAWADSTIVTTSPVQGVPYNAAPIRDNFGAAANDINALQRLNAGDTEPALPKLGNLWLDTSTTPYVLKIRSAAGSQWVPVASFNNAAAQWIPPVGGGTIPSIVSAATTNLAAYQQAAVNITGNQSIASFGTVAEGQVRFLTFAGSPTLVYNATYLILPGGANITLTPGTSAVAVSLGAGRWRLLSIGDVTNCGLFTSIANGCVPASGGGTTNFLRADGSWAAPATLTVPSADLLGGNGTSLVAVTVGTGLAIAANTLSAPVFTSTDRGEAPPSGGGTTNFLRADGTWAAPPGCGSITATAVLYSNGTTCVGDATHFFWTLTNNVNVPYSLNITTNDTTGVNGAVGMNVTGGNASRGGAAAFRQTSPGGSTRIGYADVAGQGYLTARSSDGSTIMPLAINEGVAPVSVGTTLQAFVNQPAEHGTLLTDPGGINRWNLVFGLSGDFRGGVYQNANGKTSLRLFNTGASLQAQISADSTETSFVPNRLTGAGLTDSTLLNCSAITTNGSGNLVCGGGSSITGSGTSGEITRWTSSSTIGSTGYVFGASPPVSTACLHVNSSGSITPTSTDCGTGAGGGSGLWFNVLSSVPTASSTGLSAWVNQGGSSVAETNTGITITTATTASTPGLVARSKASPATPYTVTGRVALQSKMGTGTVFPEAGIGWYDGTKLQTISVQYEVTNHCYTIPVDNWTNVTTYSATPAATLNCVAGGPYAWIRIADDGTNVSYSWSIDGATYDVLYTIAKASGFLGLSGYSNVIFYVNPQAGTGAGNVYGTLMSWTQSFLMLRNWRTPANGNIVPSLPMVA